MVGTTHISHLVDLPHHSPLWHQCLETQLIQRAQTRPKESKYYWNNIHRADESNFKTKLTASERGWMERPNTLHRL